MALHKSEHKTSQISIEYAKPEDAEAIMRLKRAAWLAAYPNTQYKVSRDDIEKKFTEKDVTEGSQNWRKGIETEQEGGYRRTFVARADRQVIGFTSPTIEEGQRRIGQLYVVPEVQGQGIGSRLLQMALDWHGENENVYLHVVVYNENAISLYDRFGFEKTGKEFPEELDEEKGIKLLPEIEMLRKGKIS
jgi:RimJ/RimL family protein N-acetyltransferase